MRYVARPPCAPLRDVVEHVWSLRDAPGHAHERIVPSGTVELVINLAEDEFRIYDASQRARRLPGAIVSGCYRAAFDIDTREHASIVGVHFKPGGAGALGIPAGELADSHVSLDALWGRAAGELRERVLAASPGDRLALVERALLARRGSYEERPAVAAARAVLERPGAAVGDVARMLQLSRRRLIELFHADVGMTPKRYARVHRFQRSLGLAASGRSWARVALESGYYDQAHLCREWAELTGLTPHAVTGARKIRVKDHHLALVTSIQDKRAHAG
jgi:AraC-like DNA-binding protein